jgi:hypothetical protein
MVFGSGLTVSARRDAISIKISCLHCPAYKRVDIGFSGQLWNPVNGPSRRPNTFNQGLKGVWLSLEVFNIFGITNTVSYLWVRDIKQHAIRSSQLP